MLVVLAVVSLVIVGLPVMANAGAPFSFTFSSTNVFCESPPQFLGFSVVGEEGDMSLDVFFEEEIGEEDFLVLGGSTDDFSFDGAILTADVDMFEDFFGGPGHGDFAGVAEFEATFEPIGEAETDFERFRDGNTWVEVHNTFQDIAVAGTAVLDGYFDFDLTECSAFSEIQEIWQTNPNAFSGRFEGRFLECALEAPDGFGSLFAEAIDNDGYTFLEMFAVAGEGSPLFGFTEGFVFTNTELSAVVELFDEETGDGPFEAVVEATLEPTGNVFVEDLTFQNGRVKTLFQELAVTGMVAVGEEVFEMVDCFAESSAERVHFSNPNGPKPTGKAPVNDAPEGALSLEDRGTPNAQTKGAANPPEIACTVFFDGENGENGENGEEPEEFPLPIGKTLWYTFEGTGGEVTVDSAGSNFDTILGVYDAGMEQLECVDDVVTDTSVTLQAAATIETEEGAMYYVQIGGFGFFEEDGEVFLGEFGRIRLTMS